MNTQYQDTFSVAKKTALLDLGDLVEKDLIERVSITGKGVYYPLAKGAPKGQKGANVQLPHKWRKWFT